MNKKQLQQQVNRYYSTNLPCKIISEIIGIGKMQFIDFIDSHFWDESINRMNYGIDWQLDHVVPQNLFNIEKREDLMLRDVFDTLIGFDPPEFILSRHNIIIDRIKLLDNSCFHCRLPL